MANLLHSSADELLKAAQRSYGALLKPALDLLVCLLQQLKAVDKPEDVPPNLLIAIKLCNDDMRRLKRVAYERRHKYSDWRPIRHRAQKLRHAVVWAEQLYHWKESLRSNINFLSDELVRWGVTDLQETVRELKNTLAELRFDTVQQSQERCNRAVVVHGDSADSGLAVNMEDSGTHPSSKKRASRSLTDMPDVWMAQLLSMLSLEDKLAVFQTCRLMRDAVLSHAKDTQLILQLLHSDNQVMTQGHSLAMASAKAFNVSVKLVGDKTRSMSTAADALITCALTKLNGSLLTGVRHITLQGMLLTCIVPSWIATSFPIVSTVQLHNCVVTSSATHSISSLLPQLRALRLTADTYVQLPERQIRQQLQSLPGLTDLCIADLSKVRAKCWSVLGRTLTKLEVGWFPRRPEQGKAASSPHHGVLAQFKSMLAQLPRIQELTVNNTLEGIKAISRMTALTKLEIKTLRRLLLVPKSCHWPAARPFTLQISHIDFYHLCKLPCGRITTIEGIARHNNHSTLFFDDDPGLDGCPGWLNSNPQLRLHCSTLSISLETSATVVTKLLHSLTPTCNHIIIRHPKVSRFNKIRDALQQLPNSIQLSICGYRSPCILHQLLPLLPSNVHTLQLISVERSCAGTEQDIQLMCRNAVLPIVVVLKDWNLEPGWQQRITDSLTDDIVTLKEQVSTADERQLYWDADEYNIPRSDSESLDDSSSDSSDDDNSNDHQSRSNTPGTSSSSSDESSRNSSDDNSHMDHSSRRTESDAHSGDQSHVDHSREYSFSSRDSGDAVGTSTYGGYNSDYSISSLMQ